MKSDNLRGVNNPLSVTVQELYLPERQRPQSKERERESGYGIWSDGIYRRLCSRDTHIHDGERLRSNVLCLTHEQVREHDVTPVENTKPISLSSIARNQLDCETLEELLNLRRD